jgi:DNA repair exonuclease SbcCD ATPase subunit
MYILKNNFYEMLIEEIGIKNFKSFGNARQSVTLNTDKGGLILLVGNNGMGKSSFLQSFDYILYGKCRGSKKKWAPQSTLPNRINGGELQIDIKFKSKGTDIILKRGISPNILELWENGVLNERAGKINIDQRIEDYIGMDLETFNSFMSMNVNSFKNFKKLFIYSKQSIHALTDYILQ